MKKDAFAACLKIIEKEGWRNFSFSKAAQDSTIPLHVFHEQFASPTDVILHLFHLIDQKVLKNLNFVENLSPKDTLFDLLMSRFEVAHPYKLVLKSFWGEWVKTPLETPPLICQGFSSMAWMLEAAGLSTRGFKGLLRIQGLTFLYILTMKTWLTDDSPDLEKTMVCLDRELTKLEGAARFLNKF